MSIIWKYLDKRAATIAAIRDMSSMQFIIDHTDEDIRMEREKMSGLGSPKFDGMPRTHNPKAGEDTLVREIDKINVLEERYSQAKEYMAWFQPAWDALSKDEQCVLLTFYDDRINQTCAVYEICERYNIERSSAYNRKNKALMHLQHLLFGGE